MTPGAAAERGPVCRFPLSRAPRTGVRAAVTAFSTLLLFMVAAPASAGLLLADARSLGGGTVAVPRCGDLSSAALSYDLEHGNVIAVSVNGLPASCDGAELRLALTTSGAAVTSGPVTVSAGSAMLYPLSSNPAYGTVTAAQLCLVG